jgi:hypothetical protein
MEYLKMPMSLRVETAVIQTSLSKIKKKQAA